MVQRVAGSIPQCFITGVTKDMVYAILSVGWCKKKKETLLLIEKSSPCGSSRFYLSLSECTFAIQ